MKPLELYELDLFILGEMIEAHAEVENEEFETKMQMIAWQTALLMNSSGNYKKKIKPQDLYSNKNKNEETNNKGSETKQELQKELLSAFADSDAINL